jgi:hypothetical protein
MILKSAILLCAVMSEIKREIKREPIDPELVLEQLIANELRPILEKYQSKGCSSPCNVECFY